MLLSFSRMTANNSEQSGGRHAFTSWLCLQTVVSAYHVSFVYPNTCLSRFQMVPETSAICKSIKAAMHMALPTAINAGVACCSAIIYFTNAAEDGKQRKKRGADYIP